MKKRGNATELNADAVPRANTARTRDFLSSRAERLTRIVTSNQVHAGPPRRKTTRKVMFGGQRGISAHRTLREVLNALHCETRLARGSRRLRVQNHQEARSRWMVSLSLQSLSSSWRFLRCPSCATGSVARRRKHTAPCPRNRDETPITRRSGSSRPPCGSSGS